MLILRFQWRSRGHLFHTFFPTNMDKNMILSSVDTHKLGLWSPVDDAMITNYDGPSGFEFISSVWVAY